MPSPEYTAKTEQYYVSFVKIYYLLELSNIKNTYNNRLNNIIIFC